MTAGTLSSQLLLATAAGLALALALSLAAAASATVVPARWHQAATQAGVQGGGSNVGDEFGD